jgi:AcrR family transcriptional regulator
VARAGLTADRLARAGAELADEVGFEHVTVSAVARRFDVKVASLYSHVQGSDDLRTRIALLALDELAELAGGGGRRPLGQGRPGRLRRRLPRLRP